MSSGKQHDRITIRTSPAIAIGAFFVSEGSLLIPILATGSYIFAGLMFGPDLDIRSNQTKRWGWFKFIWNPYQKAFKHRSVFTHGVLIGTIVRILYMAVLLLPFVVALRVFAPSFYQAVYHTLYQLKSVHFWTIFIGLELGAASHYIADVISSRLKKRNAR